MSDLPLRPRRARHDGGVREEDRVVEEEDEDEEDDTVYVNAASVRDQGSGSQGATGAQGVQRELVIQKAIVTACAVCLLLLCVLGALRTTHKAMDYRSEFEQLQANYTNLILERDQLQSEVNQLKEAVMSCPSGWKKFGDRWYFMSTEEKSWEDSRQDCLKMGADLVVINSTEEQVFIRGLNQGDRYPSWVGLKKTGDNWIWVNGIPATAQYWGSGEPDNSGNCGAYSHSFGGCSAGPCTATVKWICEK